MRTFIWRLLFPLLASTGLSAAPINVTTSILPQQYFVERIGGDQVSVSVMVQPGQSPESYEPTPKQMQLVAHADLYYRIGVPFETVWLDKLLQQGKTLPVLDARDGITLRDIESHHEHQEKHAHQEGEKDAHIWTSPKLAIHMAAGIRDKLRELAPDHAALFNANYDSLVADLQRLDNELANELKQADVRRFMVFHPSWGYFADAYQLEQIPIELEGKSPGPKSLAQVIDRARTLGIKTIFVQSQFSQTAAKTVADAIDGQVVAIDPLALDYIENLRQVGRALAGAPK